MPGDMSQRVYALGRQETSGLRLLGTGFAVGSRQVATAFHVVGPDDQNLKMSLPKMSDSSDYQDTSDSRVNTIPLTMKAADPVRDLCILEAAVGVSLPADTVIGSADETPTGAAVVTFSFPHAPQGRMVLTQHLTYVGARILIENESEKSKHLVLNTQARDGQSGGPVMSLDTQRVVAVLIGSYAPGGGGGVIVGGIDPATLHQTTHAVSAEYLGGMM